MKEPIRCSSTCSGSDCLDTVLRLRPPCARHGPGRSSRAGWSPNPRSIRRRGWGTKPIAGSAAAELSNSLSAATCGRIRTRFSRPPSNRSRILVTGMSWPPCATRCRSSSDAALAGPIAAGKDIDRSYAAPRCLRTRPRAGFGAAPLLACACCTAARPSSSGTLARTPPSAASHAGEPRTWSHWHRHEPPPFYRFAPPLARQSTRPRFVPAFLPEYALPSTCNSRLDRQQGGLRRGHEALAERTGSRSPSVVKPGDGHESVVPLRGSVRNCSATPARSSSRPAPRPFCVRFSVSTPALEGQDESVDCRFLEMTGQSEDPQ